MPETIRRDGDRLVLVLHPAEVEVLRDLAGQLETLLEGGVPERGGDQTRDATRDATRDRLFPRAYLDPTEDDAEREWQAVVHADLVRAKSDAVTALVDSLDTGRHRRGDLLEVSLALEDVEQWVGALNDVRLALGVVLEVTEDEHRVPPDDPRAQGFELYDWLTWMQGRMIETLTGAE